jgi:hypothetical protein
VTHKTKKSSSQPARGVAAASHTRVLLAAASLMGLSIGAALADQPVPASTAQAATGAQARGKDLASNQSKRTSVQSKFASNQIKATSNQSKVTSNQSKVTSPPR